MTENIDATMIIGSAHIISSEGPAPEETSIPTDVTGDDLVSSVDDTGIKGNQSFFGKQRLSANESMHSGSESHSNEPVSTDAVTSQLLHQPQESEPLPRAEAKLVDGNPRKTSPASQSYSREIGAAHIETQAEVAEDNTAGAGEEDFHDLEVPKSTGEKSTKASLEEIVRKASESLNQKISKPEASSLTAQLYEEQIKTGRINRLTCVVKNSDGTSRLVIPGAVPRLNTVDISFSGKRPMPSEACRRGEHNCFESAAARRERALSASRAQGLYPDFMRLSPKMKEFVAATILEKLRLRGLAAPLHLYKGRHLPPTVLAEMVLKPKKKKVTAQYYFGYSPPPNRPRISTELRRYLQQFTERYRAEESDLCYSYALRKVRHLADQSEHHLSLQETLAEVTRAQQEPGFGVKRLCRPHTAVI